MQCHSTWITIGFWRSRMDGWWREIPLLRRCISRSQRFELRMLSRVNHPTSSHCLWQGICGAALLLAINAEQILFSDPSRAWSNVCCRSRLMKTNQASPKIWSSKLDSIIHWLLSETSASDSRRVLDWHPKRIESVWIYGTASLVIHCPKALFSLLARSPRCALSGVSTNLRPFLLSAISLTSRLRACAPFNF